MARWSGVVTGAATAVVNTFPSAKAGKQSNVSNRRINQKGLHSFDLMLDLNTKPASLLRLLFHGQPFIKFFRGFSFCAGYAHKATPTLDRTKTDKILNMKRTNRLGCYALATVAGLWLTGNVAAADTACCTNSSHSTDCCAAKGSCCAATA